MTVTDASKIVIDNSRVMLQIVASFLMAQEVSFTIIVCLMYRPQNFR